MAESLDQEQRAKTRYFLGYFNLEQRSILSANMPVVIPQQQVLEQNMRSILDAYSKTIVVNIINEIECSRDKINKAKERLSVSEVQYAVKMNRYELQQLWQEDLKLCLQLANLLAVPLYWHPTGAGIGQVGGIMGQMYSGGGSIKMLGGF